MQHDEVIWQVINQNFCCYKVKTDTQNFCKNEDNATGLCNRQSCPLANSQYATVREFKGSLYLCMKTIERAHTPAKLWERIKLSKNYEEALKQIDTNLEHWPSFLIHKCKQRVTKITEYLAKMRKIRMSVNPTLSAKKMKIERREKKREFKALVAAKIENAIEKELLERLKNGVYDNVYNWSKTAFDNMLEKQAVEEESEESVDEFIEESDEELEIEYEQELE